MSRVLPIRSRECRQGERAARGTTSKDVAWLGEDRAEQEAALSMTPRPDLQSRERSLEFFTEVVWILEPDREPEEGVARPVAVAGQVLLVELEGRALQALGVAIKDQASRDAERGSEADEVEMLRESRAEALCVLDVERNHAGEEIHLPDGELVLWMRVEAGIADTRHVRVRLEQLGNRQSCGRVGAHSDPQGFESAHDEPAVERCERGAEM